MVPVTWIWDWNCSKHINMLWEPRGLIFSINHYINKLLLKRRKESRAWWTQKLKNTGKQFTDILCSPPPNLHINNDIFLNTPHNLLEKGYIINMMLQILLAALPVCYSNIYAYVTVTFMQMLLVAHHCVIYT